MKSLCIKTNNTHALHYLLNLLNNLNQENICFSCNNFKLYKNVIIHYTSDNTELFYTNIANILSYLVIDNFEENIIKQLINNDYFYFNQSEKNTICQICLELLQDNEEFSLIDRQHLLFKKFYNYISNNKTLVLTGFINFRLKEYFDFLDSALTIAVNKFIVEREYLEFISLLKMYINSQNTNYECVHLVYCDTNSILLDENKNIINMEENMFNAKYLSDISFSSNDYALNTLLSILPNKIYIHLINNSIDEFISTLQLIFENKVHICTDCSICNIYKHINTQTQRKAINK